MKQILMIEDDMALAESLMQGLQEAGYDVVHSPTLAEADAVSVLPDLILLDLGLPDGDGTEFLRSFHTANPGVPILIITARDGISDRVAGLDEGAADYILKPFAMPELLARIRMHLRLHSQTNITELHAGLLNLNLVSRDVHCGRSDMDLPPREFDLLACLMKSVGRPVSREQIAKDVWHSPRRMSSLDNLIDVHISRLRDRLSDEEGAPTLRTIRGVGYQLEVITS